MRDGVFELLDGPGQQVWVWVPSIMVMDLRDDCSRWRIGQGSVATGKERTRVTNDTVILGGKGIIRNRWAGGLNDATEVGGDKESNRRPVSVS